MYREEYEAWLDAPYIDDKTKEELKAIENDDKEIEDRFYQKLSFGTAGLRGIVGAGTNRMNRYTVMEASEGFAKTILEEGEKGRMKGVVIGYDVRHMSPEFAQIAAEVFAANGVQVYLFDQLCATPLLSYAVLQLGTQAGVMITASHNPKDYNGYKAYWEEGSQILDNIGDRIVKNIDAIKDFGEISSMDFEEAKEKGLIKMVGADLIDRYINEITSRKITDQLDKTVNIVYTPLNGTGNQFVRRVLEERGFTNVHIVEEQEMPDPNFTTVGYPNPEDPKAFEYAEKLGKEVDADILIATDPDSDRIAMEVKNDKGEYVFFNGNRIGALLVHHILSNLKKENHLPENGVMVKSIVTGDLSSKIAKDYGVTMKEQLTGFKNLYAIANQMEDEGTLDQFIFAYEESIGYSYGTYVRDKDAVMSAMLIAEMAGVAKQEGKTIIDMMEEIFQKYGYHKEKLISIVREGADGQAVIKKTMDEFRAKPIETLGNEKLEKVQDFSKDDYGIGNSNVLKYYYDGGSWYAVRPSGTEPKIKFYMYSVADTAEEAQNTLEEMEQEIMKKADAVL